jgi:mannosyltransferase
MSSKSSTPDLTTDGAVKPGISLWWVSVLSLTALSLVLRIVAIDHDSIWLDEAVTYALAQFPARELITGRVADLGNPPLYWVLAGLWSAWFGVTEVGLRSFPSFTGVLTVPFLALIGRRVVSPRVGLMGAFLLAISPTAIELSNEARSYSLVGLLAVTATWLFVRWIQENRGVDLALYSVTVFLTCATHYYGGAVPLAHAAGLVTLPRERRRLRSWLAAIAGAAILGLPVLRIFVRQLGIKGNLSRMGDRWLTQFLATPMVFGLGRNLAWRESPAWMLWGVTLAALACFWLPALFALSRWRRNPFGAVLLGSWAFIPIAVPLVVALTLSPIYANRYAFVGLPPFLLTTAWGLEQLRPTLRKAVLAPIVILTAASFFCYVTYPLKDDWRSETRFVIERLRPGELVAFLPSHEIAPFSYYSSRYGHAPFQMIGLEEWPDGEGRVIGMRYLNGVLADRSPRDCTDSVLSSSGLWLFACSSSEPLEFWRKCFASDGLQLVDYRRSGRIEIYHFTRQIEPAHREGDAES